MSSCDVTTTQARPMQEVPSSSGDGLQIEHQVGIGADELPDLVNEKDDAVGRPPGIQVALDPLAEILASQGECIFGTVNPFLAGLFTLAEGMGQCLDDLVSIELESFRPDRPTRFQPSTSDCSHDGL